MIELICGERNEGKTRLALNRALNDYKHNNKTVLYVSDTGTLEDFHNVLEWYEIEFLKTVCAKPYYPLTMMNCKTINEIFDIICNMRASACWPEVVCIDWHLKAKEVKEIERMGRIFTDTLFIVTVTTQTLYDAIHKIYEE